MNRRRIIGATLLVGAFVLSAIAPALAGGEGKQSVAFVTFGATLTGAAEVPGPGDPDGVGVAEVNISRSGAVCFAIAVEGIAPATLAHIHQAPAGVAGPIVVHLEPPVPFGSGDSAFSAGCVTGVSRGLIAGIAQNPDQYYVNVHNADFPAGAVRGQLAAA
jgi:hypothetical protein